MKMEVHFQILVGTDFPKWILSNISKFSYSFLKNWVPFLVTEKLLVMVSYASLQVCNYARIQEYLHYTCKQVCKYANMQGYKYVSMHIYVYASM